MDDHTIKNVSELEKALQSMSTSSRSVTPSPSPTKVTPDEPNTYQDVDSKQHNTLRPNMREMNSTYQQSSNGLLKNMSGLQTITNDKLSLLTNSVLRLNRTIESSMENILAEQRKQTQLLLTIAQNTMTFGTTQSSTNRDGKVHKTTDKKLKDFGFSNNTALVSQFILYIIEQAEIQIRSKGKGYRSSRTIDYKMIDKAVKLICSNPIKIGGETHSCIILPESKTPACVYLGSKIGMIDNVKPTINAETIVRLFEDNECRTVTSAVEEIMNRLKVLRIMIPYYEADIVEALQYPFFDKDGNIMCDWSKLTPRTETELEAKVMAGNVSTRGKLGQVLLTGVRLRSAINATYPS